jgi:hypothetical protein
MQYSQVWMGQCACTCTHTFVFVLVTLSPHGIMRWMLDSVQGLAMLLS